MKKYVLVVFFLSLSTPIVPMAAPIAKNINKYAGRLATTISFFPWIVPCIGYFTGIHGTTINEESENVALGTDRYVRNVLSEFGYDPNFINSLKIRTIKEIADKEKSPFYNENYNYEKPFSYSAYQNPVTFERSIFVPHQLNPAAQHYYQDKLTKRERQFLKLTPFQVAQAAEQIIQKHDEKRDFAFLWVPLLVHGVAQKCGQICNAVGSKIVPTQLAEKTMLQNATQITKGLLKLTVGLPAKLVASSMGILAYCQYLQKGADEAAAQKMKNHPGILKAGIQHYQDLDTKVRNDFLKNENMIYNQDFSLFNHPYHRAPFYRAQTLQKVLDEVRKEKR